MVGNEDLPAQPWVPFLVQPRGLKGHTRLSVLHWPKPQTAPIFSQLARVLCFFFQLLQKKKSVGKLKSAFTLTHINYHEGTENKSRKSKDSYLSADAIITLTALIREMSLEDTLLWASKVLPMLGSLTPISSLLDGYASNTCSDSGKCFCFSCSRYFLLKNFSGNKSMNNCVF